MSYNFPPMPVEKEFRPRSIESFDLGYIYQKENKEKLYVVGSNISLIAGIYTGKIDFRNNNNVLIQLNEKELAKIPLKRIF